MMTRICVCGKPNLRAAHAKTCSVACTSRQQRLKEGRQTFVAADRPCEVCGTAYRQTNPRHHVCSFRCQRRRRAGILWNRPPNAPIAEVRQCINCPALFTPFKEAQRLCSTPCAGRYNAKRRQIRKMTSVPECLKDDPKAVYRRDRQTCYLCGWLIDMNTTWPDPMSPTIDHRVPLSAGGPHDWFNVFATHWICNTKKGTMSIDEWFAKYPADTIEQWRERAKLLGLTVA